MTPMTKWKAIDTAWQDGRYYLAWSSKGGYVVANQPAENFAKGRWVLSELDWDVCVGKWMGRQIEEAEAATHWMPLPEPPTCD